MQKADVNGDQEQPIYTWLKKSFPGEITWNFSTKFLINKAGIPVSRFENESWEAIHKVIVSQLEKDETSISTASSTEAAAPAPATTKEPQDVIYEGEENTSNHDASAAPEHEQQQHEQ
uniref:Putative phospholipid hydroperoxide glutathione peroxidase n=1 Tax=Lygus hesperus TaxID=30085 RepID=A0A0A9YBC1_LYGHE